MYQISLRETLNTSSFCKSLLIKLIKPRKVKLQIALCVELKLPSFPNYVQSLHDLRYKSLLLNKFAKILFQHQPILGVGIGVLELEGKGASWESIYLKMSQNIQTEFPPTQTKVCLTYFSKRRPLRNVL